MIGGVFLNTDTAEAYLCYDSSNPMNNPEKGDVWEYHETDGLCWKVRYTQRPGPAPVPKVSNGVNRCADGSAPLTINNRQECKRVCSNGDVYHRDDNTCFYQNGYDDNETGGLQPRHNDGSNLRDNEIACTNGLQYVSQDAPDGPGCYQVNASGAILCSKRNQKLQTQGQGNNTTGQKCVDVDSSYSVKDKSNSSDQTPCQNGYVKDGNRCRLYTDFTNEADCRKHGGKFVLSQINDPNNGDDDVWECRSPNGTDENPNGGNVDGEDDPNADCLKDGNGNCIGGNPLQGGTKKCGEAGTNIIECDGEGVTALGNVLRIFVNVLSVAIGVAAVGGIAWASVKYAKAEDNASEVSEARTLIRNIVIGLLLYGFLIAIVNWLVPGGIIG